MLIGADAFALDFAAVVLADRDELDVFLDAAFLDEAGLFDEDEADFEASDFRLSLRWTFDISVTRSSFRMLCQPDTP